MRYGALFFLIVPVFFLLTGCDLFSNQKANVKKAYAAYEKALATGDGAVIKSTVSAARAKEFDTPEAANMIAMAAAMRPPNAQIVRVTVDGKKATIELEGTLADETFAGSAKGTVRLVKEEGKWKIDKEEWSVEMKSAAEPAPAPQAPDPTVRPYEYEKIVGSWKGAESGSTDDRWEFIFERDYRVTVTAPNGQQYGAIAMADNDLGVEDGGLRVLPGGAVIDLIIVRAAEADRRGKTALGSFRLSGTTLQACFGEPGLMKRTSSFASADGIHCYELRRVAPPETPPEQPDTAAESPDAAAATAEKPQGDPGLSGAAVVVLDGKRETYPLVAGSLFETRFTEPNKAKIQFRFPGPEEDNARRIELLLDATRTGVHQVDGKFLAENMFGLDKIDTATRTDGGWNAGFQWVADGGQLFFPKSSCTIIVTSPYTGRPDSRFAGNIKDCLVHSAGIDHTLSSVAFEVKGAPSR